MANTLSFLYLALGVTFGIVVFYVGSLALRLRSVEKDRALIEEIRRG